MDINELIARRPSEHAGLAPWYKAVLGHPELQGLSTPKLAERIGTSVATVYAWRRRLRAQPEPTSVEVNCAGGAGDQELVRAKLTGVRPLDAPASTGTKFQVLLTGGRTIIIPEQFNPSQLTSLVEALEQC